MNEIPFGAAFATAWDEWLNYRKEARYKKYVPSGLKRTFTELIRLSNNNEEAAIKMIHRAMSNNWQGFNFKLPDNGSNSKKGTSEARLDALRNWGTNTAQ